MENKRKVVIGMSGGVDSSVSVYLLQEAGYEVIGVHMLMIPEQFVSSSTAADDARAVAQRLGIPFYVLDVRATFQQAVIDYFIDEYVHGRTPNPCIVCNQRVKFELLAQYAWDLGADYVATGHYAQIEQDEQGQCYLQKAVDAKKDQSYFLCHIAPALIERIIFPLGKYTKDHIRLIAQKLGLEVANKPDSQEICFIKDNDYKQFLQQAAMGKLPQQGEFFDTEGKALGKHQGIHNYTIGQRKGLGIALGKPAYVVGIDSQQHRIVIGEEKHLLNNGLIAEENNFFMAIMVDTPIAIEAKVRYRANPAKATLTLNDQGQAQVVFESQQRAITPGQGVCYYQGDRVIGGGIIERVYNME